MEDDLRVTVGLDRRLRPGSGVRSIAAHRSGRVFDRDLSTGLPCVTPATALVQSLALTVTMSRRAPLIAAVRDRLVTSAQVRQELGHAGNQVGRAEALDVLDLIDAGCESELEIWGFRYLFSTPDFVGGVWQHRIRTRRGWFRIDLAYPDAKLAVELDGRRFHAGTERWERDVARDLTLATLGWQTIRLPHSRLTQDVEGCRRDVSQVLDQRRRFASS